MTTTTLTCPSWCDEAGLHEFDSTHDGRELRTHSLNIGSVEAVPQPLRTLNEPVYIDVVTDEFAGGGLERPLVALYANFVHLDPAQARRVATLLNAAADRLQEVQR